MGERISGVYTLFVELKAHNRELHSRTSTQQLRQVQDRLGNLQLELDNLKYERNQYRREIQSCLTLPCVPPPSLPAHIQGLSSTIAQIRLQS